MSADLEHRIDAILSKRASKKEKRKDLIRLIADDRRDFALAYLGVPKTTSPAFVQKP